MKPDKLTVYELFERERRFVVPLFQRSYVWNQEEQWEPLWDDIRRQAEAFLPEGSGHRRSHFLGAIVLNIASVQGRSVARSDVIDGQQRCTTLQLFLAALRDCAAAENNQDHASFARLTRNPVNDDASIEAFKVWPTNSDRETFAKVMRAGSPAAVQAALASDSLNGSLPRIAQAYRFFHEVVSAFANEAGDNSEKRADRYYALLQAIRTSLQLVVIELEKDDDPQVIFETLNARGQPLLPSDLIRNYVFMNTASGADEESDRLYSQYWQHFDTLRLDSPDAAGESRFWHVLERQGRLQRPRIDLFIFHYLVMKTERDIAIGHLFDEFRDWREAAGDTTEAFLADLKSYSSCFAALIAPTGPKRIDTLARRLKSLDTNTVYPLLLFLSGLPHHQLTAAELDQAIVDLESYLVRRFICGLTTKNYNRFFLTVLQKAKRAAAEGSSVAQAIRDELQRSEDPTSIWPSDSQFRQGWMNTQVYTKSRVDRCAMLLRAVEQGMRSTRNENITIPETLTVEHLLPQKGSTSDYPFASGVELRLDETPERARARLIHTIGNLTLLTQSLNSSVSNGPFPEKRAKIVADSDLRLNAWLRSDDRQTWTEAEIQSRGEVLFEHGLRVWPKPPATA